MNFYFILENTIYFWNYDLNTNDKYDIMGKILFIIVTGEIWENSFDNIRKLNEHLKIYKNKGHIVDVALLVRDKKDMNRYDDIINIKYKYYNQKKQLSKLCDFISDTVLDYNWYVKMRTEIEFLSEINFDTLCKNSINARARKYNGPLCLEETKIKYGASIGGKGTFGNKNQFNSEKGDGSIKYTKNESLLILDDIVYIFHENIINQGGFNKLTVQGHENEWFHTSIWKQRNIKLKVIGIKCLFTYFKKSNIEMAIRDGGCHWYYSGDIPL